MGWVGSSEAKSIWVQYCCCVLYRVAPFCVVCARMNGAVNMCLRICVCVLASRCSSCSLFLFFFCAVVVVSMCAKTRNTVPRQPYFHHALQITCRFFLWCSSSGLLLCEQKASPSFRALLVSETVPLHWLWQACAKQDTGKLNVLIHNPSLVRRLWCCFSFWPTGPTSAFLRPGVPERLDGQ